MGLPAPDRTATWNGRVPPRVGVVGMIESAAQQLNLTGSEGVERYGEEGLSLERLGADDSAGDTSADGDGGGDERRPARCDGGDDGRHGRDNGGDASQEGALTRPLGGLLGGLGGLLGRLVGGGGNGGGGLRHLRQCRREAAPHGGGSGLRCRWLGSRRHGSDPQNCACGAQQRARLDGRVVPAINSPIEEGFNRDIDPLEGVAALLLVELSLHEKASLPRVDVRHLSAEHRPEGVNDALKHSRIRGGGLCRRGWRPRRRGGWCGGHLSSSQARGRVLRPSG